MGGREERPVEPGLLLHLRQDGPSLVVAHFAPEVVGMDHPPEVGISPDSVLLGVAEERLPDGGELRPQGTSPLWHQVLVEAVEVAVPPPGGTGGGPPPPGRDAGPSRVPDGAESGSACPPPSGG
jgi:hypothetical protein